jgi:phosphoglycerate dehydrogenase-like enzyme
LLEGDPLWSHPKVQIMPHVSGWRSYVVEDIVENYRRMKAKEPLLNLVDRSLGY